MSGPISRTSLNEDSDPSQVVKLAELLGALKEDATAAYEAQQAGRPRGPITGLPQLDKHLGGRLAPGLNVIHGGPGIGKTAWALQIAATCGFPALYITCEMAPLELLRRIIARETTTSLDWIRGGQIKPEVMLDKAETAIAACPELSLLDLTRQPVAWDLLTAAVKQAKGDARHVLVVVDSIHSWADGFQGEAEEYTALNTGLAALRTLARQLDCPLLGIAERNRASMKAGGLSASAGTRKFEFGAEAMFELDANPEEAKSGAGERPVTLKISKNRNGSHGQTVNLLWHDAYQRFREVPRP